MAFGDRRRGIGSHRIAEAAGLRIAARALPDLGLRQRRGVGERDRGQQDDERAHWDPSEELAGGPAEAALGSKDKAAGGRPVSRASLAAPRRFRHADPGNR
jgi:hypothetical protein